MFDENSGLSPEVTDNFIPRLIILLLPVCFGNLSINGLGNQRQIDSHSEEEPPYLNKAKVIPEFRVHPVALEKEEVRTEINEAFVKDFQLVQDRRVHWLLFHIEPD